MTSTFFVAIIFTSVFKIFLINIEPILIGALILIELISFITKKILSLSIGSLVLQENYLSFPLFTNIVEVTVLFGKVISFLAYSSPLGQKLPVTLSDLVSISR